jgi:membrane carboxypeptidase/penicillin-binding protein PbpC
VSPSRSQVVVLIPGVDPSDQEVPLEGDSEVAHATLAWFVDGELLARAPADERVWWTPHAGEHDLVVMDESGAMDRQRLVVRNAR